LVEVVVRAAAPRSAQVRAEPARQHHHWASAREPARQQWIGSAADATEAQADAMGLPVRARVPRAAATALLARAKAAEGDAMGQPLGAMQPPVRAKAAGADAKRAAETQRGPCSRLP
jgi:hypothetical protein